MVLPCRRSLPYPMVSHPHHRVAACLERGAPTEAWGRLALPPECDRDRLALDVVRSCAMHRGDRTGAASSRRTLYLTSRSRTACRRGRRRTPTWSAAPLRSSSAVRLRARRYRSGGEHALLFSTDAENVNDAAATWRGRSCSSAQRSDADRMRRDRSARLGDEVRGAVGTLRVTRAAASAKGIRKAIMDDRFAFAKTMYRVG